MGNCWSDAEPAQKKEANLEEFEALLKERERLKRELESSNKRNYALQGQLEGIKRKEGSFQIQIDGYQQQLATNASETKRLLAALDEQGKKVATNASETKRLLATLDEQGKQVASYKQVIDRLKRDIDSLNSQLRQNNDVINSLTLKVQQLTQENERLKKENQSLKAKVEANRFSEKSESEPGYLVHRATRFFSGDVLDQFDDFKIYLTDILEKEMGMVIRRTQLLFRYEKALPRNLHAPVDGHGPVVLLIKTVKGYHIACVSEAPFAPKSGKQGRGWLISLTKGRVYRSAAGKQAVLYDEMYLIFGNQEIRVDGSSNKVFSNFGISNSFYNTSGNDVRDFLGPALDGTPREAELESFEVFKLIAE